MLVIYLLAFLATSYALEVEVSTECSTCIFVNDGCYNITKVLDLKAPFRSDKVVIHKMGILRKENKLYFSFEPLINDTEYYKVGFVNLDNQEESGVISLQNFNLNFGTFDIDQDNKLVYLGGSDGIFVFDYTQNKLAPFSSRGDTIERIFYKNYVYFVKDQSLGIIVKKGDFFQMLLEGIPVKNFVVNKYDYIVFLNQLGLHIAKGNAIYTLTRYPFYRGITMDLDGNIYVWWIDAIYKVVIDKQLHYSKLEKYADLPGIGAMTFDNQNNIVFTIDEGLYKMTPSAGGCLLPPTPQPVF